MISMHLHRLMINPQEINHDHLQSIHDNFGSLCPKYCLRTRKYAKEESKQLEDYNYSSNRDPNVQLMNLDQHHHQEVESWFSLEEDDEDHLIIDIIFN